MIYDFCRNLDWMHDLSEDVMRCEDMIAGLIVSLNERRLVLSRANFINILYASYDEVCGVDEAGEVCMPRKEVFLKFIESEADNIYSFYADNLGVVKIIPNLERLKAVMARRR